MVMEKASRTASMETTSSSSLNSILSKFLQDRKIFNLKGFSIFIILVLFQTD